MKKSFDLDVNGIMTHYLRLGEGRKKFVVLHGWDQNIDVEQSYDSLIFDLERDGFLDKGKYQIILPNFPGFGKSGMPPKEGFGTEDYAKWLEAFLKAVKIKKAVFLTHSFGGRVLVRFLRLNPEFSTKAIMMASAGIKWPLSWRQKLSIKLSKKFVRAKELIPQKLQKILLNKILGAKDWGAVKPELKPTLEKVLAEPDFRNELPKIEKTKVLLIWGAKDGVTPLKSGIVFEQMLGNAKLKTFPDGKHGIHRSHAKEVSKEIVKFLK